MQGNSDSKFTNKTEFMRYLDEHPDSIPALSHRLKEYHLNLTRGASFGGWMRQKYLPEFARFYHSWWLKRPNLYGKVYQQQQEALSV